MTNDTTTPEGLKKELYKRVEGYEKTGNKVGIVRLIGGSIEDYGDFINGFDSGEPLRDYR